MRYNKLKFPNGLYFEDNLFFTKAITKATRLGIIQDKLYFRRIHNDSITQNLNYHFQDLIKINEIAKNLDPSRPTGGIRNFKNSELLEDVYTYNDFL